MLLRNQELKNNNFPGKLARYFYGIPIFICIYLLIFYKSVLAGFFT